MISDTQVQALRDLAPKLPHRGAITELAQLAGISRPAASNIIAGRRRKCMCEETSISCDPDGIATRGGEAHGQ